MTQDALWFTKSSPSRPTIIQCSSVNCSVLFFSVPAGWERQLLPLLILCSPCWCEDHSAIEEDVSGVSLQLLVYGQWSIISITTSWEINTGGEEFYQQVWSVSVGSPQTSISFHSTLMEQRTLMKTELSIFPQLDFPIEHVAFRYFSKSLSLNKIY